MYAEFIIRALVTYFLHLQHLGYWLTPVFASNVTSRGKKHANLPFLWKQNGKATTGIFPSGFICHSYPVSKRGNSDFSFLVQLPAH